MPSSTPNEHHPLVIYNLAVCATMGGAIFGYDTAIINGANLLIKEEFSLSHTMVQHIVSATVGAAAVFSLLSGIISDAIGRKMAIMLSAVVFVVGGILQGMAPGPMVLLVGRVVVGIGVGLVSSVVPIYVSECAPQNIRGCLITLHQVFITLGAWLSAVLAVSFQGVHHGWRYMLGLSAIPGVIQFLLFLWLPESPRWHVMKNKEHKAALTLAFIRDTHDVADELEEMIKSIEEERKTKGIHVWVRIFTTPHVRYSLLIGCMLQMLQQFSGINAVMYYSSNILRRAGFDVKQAIWLSVVPFTINFVATFIGLWAVEVMGRVKVLAFSFFAIFVAMLIIVAAFIPGILPPPAANKRYEPDIPGQSDCFTHDNCRACTVDNSQCGYCYTQLPLGEILNGSCVQVDDSTRYKELYSKEGRCAKQEEGGNQSSIETNVKYAVEFCPTPFAWLAVLGIILFVLGFAPGAGPMPWTINAEIYPLWSRSVANSIATFTNWTCNFIVSQVFLTLMHSITIWGTFLLFAVVSFVGAFLVLLLVPETKNRSLEEIEMLFMDVTQREAYTRKAELLTSSMETEASSQRSLDSQISHMGSRSPRSPRSHRSQGTAI